MKICTLCKSLKPVKDFGKHAQKTDGLSSWCLLCAREKARKRAALPEQKEKKRMYDKNRHLDPVIRQKAIAKAHKHYETNKAYRKQKIMEWQKQNPEKALSYKKTNKYKRREVVNNSTVSAKEFLVWENSQLKLCSYCGISCTNNYQIDHIDPLAKLGAHELDNLTITCPTCNREKSDRILIVWLAKRNT